MRDHQPPRHPRRLPRVCVHHQHRPSISVFGALTWTADPSPMTTDGSQ